MKKRFIILSMLISSSLLANELSWVDEQVQAIKPTRAGMKTSSLSALKAPFVYLEKNQTKKKKKPKEDKKSVDKVNTTNKKNSKKSILYTNKKSTQVVHQVMTLTMILNNSALINKKWYKIGEIVSGYKIKKIYYNSVLLVNKSKKLLLSTKTDNKKLKFQK